MIEEKRIFISYSHSDEEYKDSLINHLSGLKNNGLIKIWDDRNITIGEKWDDKINDELLNSDIVLFLISSEFLASEYINEKEIRETISRHKKGEVLVIPILIRPCDFESSILSDFQSVPRDLKTIIEFDPVDLGYLEVVKELRKLITTFKPKENKSSKGTMDNSETCCSKEYEIKMSTNILSIINEYILSNSCNQCKVCSYDEVEKLLKSKISDENDIRIAINYLQRENCIEFSYSKDRHSFDIEYLNITLEGETTLRRNNR